MNKVQIILQVNESVPVASRWNRAFFPENAKKPPRKRRSNVKRRLPRNVEAKFKKDLTQKPRESDKKSAWYKNDLLFFEDPFLCVEVVFRLSFFFAALRYGNGNEEKGKERKKQEEKVGKKGLERIENEFQTHCKEADDLLIEKVKVDGGYHVHTGVCGIFRKEDGTKRKNGNQKSQK